MRTHRLLTILISAAFIAPMISVAASASAGDKNGSKELQKKAELELEFRLGLRHEPGGKKVSLDEGAIYRIQQPGIGARFRSPSLIDLLSHPERLFNIVSNGSLAQSAPKNDMLLSAGEAVRIRAVSVSKAAQSFYLELITTNSYPTVDDSGNSINSPALAFVYFDCPSELAGGDYDAVLKGVFRWVAPEKPASLPTVTAAGLAFKHFEHSRYTISYPADWQLQGSQYANVVISPKNGIHKNLLEKGVMIAGFQPASSSSAEPDANFRLLIEELRRSHPYLQTGPTRELNLGNSIAKSTELTGHFTSSDLTMQEHDLLVAVPRQDGSLLYLAFVSPEAEFANMRPVFSSVLETLQVPDAVPTGESNAESVQSPTASIERRIFSSDALALDYTNLDTNGKFTVDLPEGWDASLTFDLNQSGAIDAGDVMYGVRSGRENSNCTSIVSGPNSHHGCGSLYSASTLTVTRQNGRKTVSWIIPKHEISRDGTAANLRMSIFDGANRTDATPSLTFVDMSSSSSAEVPSNEAAAQSPIDLKDSQAAAPGVPPEPAIQPIAPPHQPTDAHPPHVSLGQTMDQVIGALGQPTKIERQGKQTILTYSNLKVILVDGMVTDVK